MTSPQATPRIPLRTKFFSGHFETDTGFLRSVCAGDVEVLRAIYGAVRDEDWNTVPSRCEVENLRQEEDSFDLAFTVNCRLAAVSYGWRGRISGRGNALEFRFDGRSESAFRRNRIGLCVLHPPAECVGQPCQTLETDGAWHDRAFPGFISPHQPFQNLRALSWRPADRLKAEIEFAGDVFETEDQRNWTDASFKTYSTPLAIPFPVAVAPGDEVHQSVRLVLTPDAGETLPPPRVEAAPVVSVCVDLEQVIGDLPALGLGLNRDGEGLTPWQEERLRDLRLNHLRVVLPLSHPNWQERLRKALDIAKTARTWLQCALFLSDQARTELEDFRDAVESAAVERCLIFHQAEKVTAARWHQLAREILEPHGYPLTVGTDAYFTEINRERPSRDTAVCYSFNPQVHAFDDHSMMETLEAQPETVRSAEQFCDRELVITPITLLPRSNPNATSGTNPATAPDPRQQTALGAAWTAGTLAQLAPLPRVASLTFYEVTGEHGVMGRETAEVYPLYHVFRALAGVRELLATSVSHPHRVRVLAGRRQEEGAVVCLVANTTPDPQTVEFTGPAAGWRWTNVEQANGELPTVREPLVPRDGAPARIELGAYAVVVVTDR